MALVESVLGIVMIAGGVVLLLRACAPSRASLVAKIVGLDPDTASPGGARSSSTLGYRLRLKSFEEEVNDLNDELRRNQ